MRRSRRVLSFVFLLSVISFLFYRGCNPPPKDVLTVGVSYGFPRGSHDGFNWDLARFLGQKLHKEVKLRVLKVSDFSVALRNNEIDVMCAPLNITDERLREMAMVHVYGGPFPYVTFLFWDSSHQKELSHAKHIRDMVSFFEKRSIGVAIPGAIWAKLLKEYGVKNIKTYGQESHLVSGLKKGEVAAVVLGRVSTDFVLKQHPNMWALTVALDKPYSQGIGVALNKERKKLIKQVADVIKDLKDDGTILMLQSKWFGKQY